jgi:hypothetical protein
MCNDVLLVVSPEHYDTLVRGGITTKAKLQEKLWHLCNKEMAPKLRKLVTYQYGALLGNLVGGLLGTAARAANLLTGVRGQPAHPLPPIQTLSCRLGVLYPTAVLITKLRRPTDPPRLGCRFCPSLIGLPPSTLSSLVPPPASSQRSALASACCARAPRRGCLGRSPAS